jgi:hypothetical protein
MSNESQIREIELSIEQAQEYTKVSKALTNLFNNKDFIEVIKVGYFKEEPARLVEMKAAPEMQTEKLQTAVMNAIDGIGALQQYFNTIWSMAREGEKAIADGNEALDDIAKEEASEGEV